MESCVIKLTAAAEKHGNLNIAPCGPAFFPKDAIGGSTKAQSAKQVTIIVDGLPHPVRTDIPRDRRWLISISQGNLRNNRVTLSGRRRSFAQLHRGFQ